MVLRTSAEEDFKMGGEIWFKMNLNFRGGLNPVGIQPHNWAIYERGGTRIKRYEGNFRGNFHEQEQYCEERNKRLFDQSGPHSIAGRRGGRLWKSASSLPFHHSVFREGHQEPRRGITPRSYLRLCRASQRPSVNNRGDE